MLKKELLEILCCPKCKSDLDYNAVQNTLRCKGCGTVYQVKNDTPILVTDNVPR